MIYLNAVVFINLDENLFYFQFLSIYLDTFHTIFGSQEAV